tara:strand:+ start:427 stop:1143 length:717 start_codon:yes stop_codon:yes gene_type:complete
MSNDYTIIMENWRGFIAELNIEPVSGFTPPETVSRATTNQEKLQSFKLLMSLNHDRKALQRMMVDVKNFLDSSSYGTFAAYWNATIGWLLPNLPRDGSSGELMGFAVELVIWLLLLVFGGVIIRPIYKFGKVVIKIFLEAIKRNAYALSIGYVLGIKGLLEFSFWAGDQLAEKWNSEMKWRNKELTLQLVSSAVKDISSDMAGQAKSYMEGLGYVWCKVEGSDAPGWAMPDECPQQPE